MKATRVLTQRMWLAVVLLALAGCSYKEVERELGYKGRARVNPWLAAERFCEATGHTVISTPTWRDPEWEDAVWFVPGSVLETRSFTRRMEEWMDDGGHLVVLMENAESQTNDWGARPGPPPVTPALREMLERAGIGLAEEAGSGAHKSESVHYNGRDFHVAASSRARVSLAGAGDEPGALASMEVGDGRLTVLTDAGILRNRWIDQHEHAALLAAILDDWSGDPDWRIGFMRGTGLSFWRLLGQHLWPVLLGLGVWLFFWLWRNFGRFGPIQAADEPTTIRGYDHHLEALGGFHWEIDHANGLLGPVRARIVERAMHLSAAVGRRDDDLFLFLAERAGLPRERVARALTEARPADAATLTRTTADLQSLIHAIQ